MYWITVAPVDRGRGLAAPGATIVQFHLHQDGSLDSDGPGLAAVGSCRMIWNRPIRLRRWRSVTQPGAIATAGAFDQVEAPRFSAALRRILRCPRDPMFWRSNAPFTPGQDRRPIELNSGRNRCSGHGCHREDRCRCLSPRPISARLCR